ncbi:N-ATPase subunit AtpR [Lignipirellula cremea]|uniref:N-ATPase, AtpR subunit n=1 Tax=Lignipirellula cremea TaxID=2528010 RepID=A0A518E4C7_9BACT|nr:ATP synthase subunit I [Lignipirellula cremea]QDU98930.1 N-ATPase, AtpR subunit [Lignipirellula cremea]
MTMNEPVSWILPLAAGVLLGAMFFGGLWWTIRKGLTSRHPAAWFLGSQLLRMSVALTGFYLVAGGHWERLLVCLVGFLIARFAVARLTRSSGDTQSQLAKEASDAS